MATPVAFGPIAVPASAGAMFTVPGNQIAIITQMSVTNVSAGNATLKLWLVRSGGTRVTGNIVYGATAAGQSILAGPAAPTILAALVGMVLLAGDALHGLTDTAGALNIMASGIQ